MAAPRRGSWPVLAVNSSVAVTVLVLVAVLALVVNPPAPPGIAAFAPQASKPITKAPPGQSSQFGNGAGACGRGQVCAGSTPTPTPRASATASSTPTVPTGAVPPGLQCYEWAPGVVTQTFDPQSPPCISRWDDSKGNGGATSPGVTERDILVALPVAAPGTSNWPGISPLVDFYNSHYQFYGRKIKIVPVPSKQADGNLNGQWNDPALQKADAAEIKARKVFATFDFMDPISESSTHPVFLDEMAKAKIVSINGGETTPWETARALEKRAPYAWSYYPTVDRVTENLAVVVCRQLAGKNANHSPDPVLRTKPRKFAIWLPTTEQTNGELPGLGSMLATLRGCGVEPKVIHQATGVADQGATSAALTQLKSDNYTSIIFLPWGGNGSPGSALGTAQQVGYRPEWVVIGWNNYNTAFMLKDPPAETAGAFGVGMWNKQPQTAEEPWKQASTSAGGTVDYTDSRAFYQELQLLASGIQMAGPKLTPETFAEGLHSTRFANPGAAGPPSYQGTVGFPGSDVVMVSDYLAFWLDTRRSGADVSSSPTLNQEKAFCQVAFGRRWADETWPRVDRFYETGVCR